MSVDGASYVITITVSILAGKEDTFNPSTLHKFQKQFFNRQETRNVGVTRRLTIYQAWPVPNTTGSYLSWQ